MLYGPMMTTDIELHGRLLPGRAWFFRWLKIYARIAIVSVCGFMVVAGWMAEHTVLRTLITAAAAIMAAVVFAGLLAPSTPAGESAPPADGPQLRRQIILSFHIAGLWFSVRAGMRQREDRSAQHRPEP